MRMAPQERRTYFVTTVAAQRRTVFEAAHAATLLQDTLFDYRGQEKYLLHAYVVMPDHLHLLLTPAPDISLERAVQFIKGGFSFRLKSPFDVWMRSFNEAQILTSERCRACVGYIEQNPVRKRLAARPGEYPYSSAHRHDMDPVPAHLQG